MITVAICDDEEQDLSRIYQLVKNAFENVWSGQFRILTYSNGVQLLQDTETLKTIDLIYLDIMLPDSSGFIISDKLKGLQEQVKIIFVSSYDNLVYQSLLYQPFLFLKKEWLEQEVEGSVHYFLKHYTEQKKYCVFRLFGKELAVNLKDIIYMTSYGHELTVFLKESRFICRDSIQRRKAELVEHGFVQSHISCLINLRHVVQIKPNEVIMRNGESVALSRTRREEVKAAYLKFLR